jgi:hypothetical protein
MRDGGGIHHTGLRLTAGWARQPEFSALYGSTTPPAVLGETLQSRPPMGAVGRGPAALRASTPGKKKKTFNGRSGLKGTVGLPLNTGN